MGVSCPGLGLIPGKKGVGRNLKGLGQVIDNCGGGQVHAPFYPAQGALLNADFRCQSGKGPVSRSSKEPYILSNEVKRGIHEHKKII
jgi:hypothetical protein